MLELQSIVDARTANAFLFGNILNQFQKSQRSFDAPYLLEQRLGTIEPKQLLNVPEDILIEQMMRRPALHPMAESMSFKIRKACELLLSEYNSDARNIWTPPLNSPQQLINRFCEFSGIGLHKAQVAYYLLVNVLHCCPDLSLTFVDIENVCPQLFFAGAIATT